MKTFETMDLPAQLKTSLNRMTFHTPTPIQEQVIPLALKGQDIVGSAQTGTGKTGAFGIPLISKLMNDPAAHALVITPTRELAAQVMKQLQDMLDRKSPLKTALLIGGDSLGKQFQHLKKHPQLIVGTPGRINDHLERGTLLLKKTSFLVLDETDRMLDMGFSIQIDKIMTFLPQKRQTLLFSATFPKNILHLAEKYLHNPARISVNPPSSAADNIKQDVMYVGESEKYAHLISQLEERQGSVIVFVKTKLSTEKMAAKLSQEGLSANAIHGDLRQNKRTRVISDFKKQKYRILVATDVAARGLDIPHIEHVINYDLPQCAEDYIHRIGRTGRAGAKGSSLCLLAPKDKGKWKAIHRLMNPGLVEKEPFSHAKKKPFLAKKRKDSRSKFFDRKASDFKFHKSSGSKGTKPARI